MCAEPDCESPIKSRGLCKKHYEKWRTSDSFVRFQVTSKVCNECGYEGPVEDFAKWRRVCRPCAVRMAEGYKKANPEKIAAIKAKSRLHPDYPIRSVRAKAKYMGVDDQEVVDYFLNHSGLCDICKKEVAPNRKLDIDHDHQTMTFRGFLCGSCNRALGLFYDNKDSLQSAILYLEAHERKVHGFPV